MSASQYLTLSQIESQLAALPSARERTILWARLAIERYRQGAQDLGLGALRAAESAAAGLPAEQRDALVESWLVDATVVKLFFTGEFAASAQLSVEALARWGPALPASRRLEMTSRAALHLCAAFRRSEAIVMARRVLADAARTPYAEFQAHLTLGIVCGRAGLGDEGLDHFRRAKNAASASGDAFSVGSVINRMAVLQGFSAWERSFEGTLDGETLKQAIVALRSTIDLWRDRGQHQSLIDQHLLLAQLLVEQGQIDEAMGLWAQHVPVAREQGHAHLWPPHQAHWARRMAMRGQVRLAIPLIEQAEQALPALPQGLLIRRAALHHLAGACAAVGLSAQAARHREAEAAAAVDFETDRRGLQAELAAAREAPG